MNHQLRRDGSDSKSLFKSLARPSLRIAVIVGVTGFVAFAFTPACCVLGWLFGYGPGGMTELHAQNRLTEMWNWSVSLSPVHLLAILLPQRPRTRVAGIAVSAVLVFLSYYYWFIAAAAIASV